MVSGWVGGYGTCSGRVFLRMRCVWSATVDDVNEERTMVSIVKNIRYLPWFSDLCFIRDDGMGYVGYRL